MVYANKIAGRRHRPSKRLTADHLEWRELDIHIKSKHELETILAYLGRKWHMLETMLSVLGEKEAMQSLGTQIRAQRLRRNFSQSHIAGILGVSEPTYRKIESGDGSVEFRNVAKTLAILGFDQALAQLIPEVEPDIRMADLLAPRRKKAYQRKPK